MVTGIALLRGINVGGKNLIKMEVLRDLCESIGLLGVQTYVQSGNVVFQTKKKTLTPLGPLLEAAIEKQSGFRPSVVLRSLPELQQVMERCPFPERDPAKILVNFFPIETSAQAQEKVLTLKIAPEELHISGREHFIFFPNGQGQSKYPAAAIDKIVGARGTGRNWNTVRKLLELASSFSRA